MYVLLVVAYLVISIFISIAVLLSLFAVALEVFSIFSYVSMLHIELLFDLLYLLGLIRE
jgi:hypothetical protein